MEGWLHNMTDIWHETPYMVPYNPTAHNIELDPLYHPHRLTRPSFCVPMQFCPGNHEDAGGRNSSLSQRNFTSYRERFHMPYMQSGSSSNMFYSFDYGLVHFINIDTESTFPGAPEGKNSGPFGDQAAWLKADLAKATANRAKVPWILVGGHRPFWATDGYIKAQMEFFFPIFDQFDIDAVFVGHIHYVRQPTLPMSSPRHPLLLHSPARLH